jgi:hypothetical protein
MLGAQVVFTTAMLVCVIACWTCNRADPSTWARFRIANNIICLVVGLEFLGVGILVHRTYALVTVLGSRHGVDEDSSTGKASKAFLAKILFYRRALMCNLPMVFVQVATEPVIALIIGQFPMQWLCFSTGVFAAAGLGVAQLALVRQSAGANARVNSERLSKQLSSKTSENKTGPASSLQTSALGNVAV